MSKVGQLSKVHTEIFGCTKCQLHKNRTRTVPGAGNPDAEILFIGEAPGYHEDQQGLPFVGKSGDYLEELLAEIGMTRHDVFIANVIKCRPPNNRDPFKEEVETCTPYLARQIEILDPLVIATLGRFSMEMFISNAKISKIHGQPHYDVKRAYYPLYHPAAVLRNSNLRAVMQDDFARLLDVVAEVKQRRDSGEMDAAAEVDAIPETAEDDSPNQSSLF